MPSNNNAPLQRPSLRRKAKKETLSPVEKKNADKMVKKGSDEPISSGKTTDFGVPLSAEEHKLFTDLEELISAEMAVYGGKASRRSLARLWLVERIRAEAEKRGL